jgi:hypothetical protein
VSKLSNLHHDKFQPNGHDNNQKCHACLVRFSLAQGSGVQAVALGRRCPSAELTLVDKSPRALRFAKFNLLLNGISSARARLVHSDLYSSLPPLPAAAEAEEGLGFFDLITANPPFVPNPRLDYPDLSEEEKEEQQEEQQAKRSDVGGSSTSSGEERGSSGGGSSSFPAAADALYADGGERGVTVLQVRNPPSVALSFSHATR